MTKLTHSGNKNKAFFTVAFLNSGIKPFENIKNGVGFRRSEISKNGFVIFIYKDNNFPISGNCID